MIILDYCIKFEYNYCLISSMTVCVTTDVIKVLEYSSKTANAFSDERRLDIKHDIDVVHLISRFESFLGKFDTT